METKPVNALVSLFPLIIIFFIFYVLLILPGQKKQKKHQMMLENLREGDRVVTIGGIFGKISKIKGNIITLEIAERVKVDLARSGISRKVE
ncbi:MAG: preprotein translocase subunit YajC [bacterium (Candidatus Ratteibacteria) CG_4_10_14_3_um_filter_41_18]|uniref:Preprotein translocase subunit YajC n=3 Tax=Candidatus Ratteibacteria TaxID=2979319 RepID=A0A2M7YEK5_9BACT|nr:MAG: preprotein translocase subunit YajC [Candidatus Omnitrophica bacterium CG1_02_41_171]PIV63791.1 MAG: preprotein translocase subunit YajC [bacterium (Candidatus Ratteibacteria) CG01_land_8_20_14_3_00_40_19]PIW73809.1 MAG: preprotein translocase subunit YajC [bacterium (Candidatus Ratteibacteria) CG_4_8_14_3_um_filter_41_36]PIX77730.1 MAG: preprotein translocase subunit YajC [bacterium (Candidatus Ratteibacteria) CG_4_10_14_3_um_filter_41_18]PJA61411.1 MAG: preprotein translocase subunit 